VSVLAWDIHHRKWANRS